jgi:twitching motility two-component system response regulator PilG
MNRQTNSPHRGKNNAKDIPADMLSAASATQEDCTADLTSSCSDPQSEPAKTMAGNHATERRKRRRAVISAAVRVRNVDATKGPDEATTTLDVSRNGLLIKVSDSSFYRGMDVMVTFPYTRLRGVPQAEQPGRVVRVSELPEKFYSVAIALNAHIEEGEAIDSQGKLLDSKKAAKRDWQESPLNPKKPLVLAVDADPAIRISLKTYLEAEGYEVIAVGTSDEAHEVLGMFTPALVLAEIEGADLPGYELCAYIKGTPRLQTTPVVLLTSSAYPSDYANAHSLGAVVCMAKPFRQDRLGHVVRLLAPTAEAKMQTVMACKPDPQRNAASNRKESSIQRPPARFRLRSPW